MGLQTTWGMLLDQWAPWVMAVGIGLLVGLALLRSASARDLVTAAGVRLVQVGLAWLEAWVRAGLEREISRAIGRGGAGALVTDGRLARVCRLRKLAGEL